MVAGNRSEQLRLTERMSNVTTDRNVNMILILSQFLLDKSVYVPSQHALVSKVSWWFFLEVATI